MKLYSILFLLFSVVFVHGQSLPIDFESDILTADFVDFDGGIATVIPNPQSGGINSSSTVAQIVRDGGTIWSGSKIPLASNLEFTTLNSISMKVFSTAPVGTVVKFKLEGNGTAERDEVTTTTNEWETMIWDFTGEPSSFNEVVFMFDFGNVGDGSASSTFLFDDVEQVFGGTQLDLPVDFESSTVNYTTTDFGGNVSSLVVDPEDAGNHVVQAIKTNGAATWAGTTIGTPAGFASFIPLTLTDSKMTVRVWSPEANTPIRLKVEDSSDPTHTCETETNTSVAAGWETVEFDFTNQAPGTELLSVGLNMGWKYNMASIFFDFGTEGSAAEKVYYFDEVRFGDLSSSVKNDFYAELGTVFPNPTNREWTISLEHKEIVNLQIFNQVGQLLFSANPNSKVVNVDASSFSSGRYLARISTATEVGSLKLLKN